MATSTWALPTPTNSAVPCGHDQMRDLAQAFDAVLAGRRDLLRFPVARFAFGQVLAIADAMTITVPVSLIAQSSHNIYSVTANAIVPSVAGCYRVEVSALVNYPYAATTFGTANVLVDVPPGTTQQSFGSRVNGANWQGIQGSILVTVNPAASANAIGLRFQNNAQQNVNANLWAGWVFVTRIGGL